MFKDWEQMKLTANRLKKEMGERSQKELESAIEFAEMLSEQDRRLYLYPILRKCCDESRLWPVDKLTFIEWLEREIKEVENMIEYYKVNNNE